MTPPAPIDPPSSQAARARAGETRPTATPGTEPATFRLPAAWRIGFVSQQVAVLLLASLACLFVTRGSPLYEAAFNALPDLLFPGGIIVPTDWLIPLALPVALGIPLALTRQRALLLLWIGVMMVVAVIGVIEVSLLNWPAFVSGVAFRVASGPVPLVRTIAGGLLLLCGALLLAQQSVHGSLVHLAERGVRLAELRACRAGILAVERAVVGVAAIAAVVLTVVALVSMTFSEGAPDADGNIAVPLAWTAILVLVGAAGLAWGTRRLRDQ